MPRLSKASVSDSDFSFSATPFISPEIVRDFSPLPGDHGDQVIAINLTESFAANRYFGNTKVRNTDGQYPFVYVEDPPDDSNAHPDQFGYRYVGKTANGIFVIRTMSEAGASRESEYIMLLTIERDTGIYINKSTKFVENKPRLLLKKVTEYALDNKWKSDVSIDRNKLTVHRANSDDTQADEGNYSIDLSSIVTQH